MKILQICNGFADSKVHSNLTKALDGMGVEQTVYCPVREERLLGKNRFEGECTEFVYSYCIKLWYKYVYQFKRWMLYRDILRKVDLQKFDLVQAPTLFSDGGLALKVYQKYGIPYIVAVRNTDINLYMRRLKHTHCTGRQIALYAAKIVFISKGEMQEFVESDFVKPIYDRIKDKIVFQPNGIEDYWHEHISHEQRTGHDVLYIGDYTPNKNVGRLIDAILQLREEKGFEDTRLIIVGGEKVGTVWKTDENLKQKIADNPNAVKALGKIYDNEKLQDVMHRCALFAMPSIHETFGLVYIEALSQNLPVIYTKGQGIDGIFDGSVGEGVNALLVDEIREAVRKVMEHPERYSNATVKFEDFNWHCIARNYIRMYEEIKNTKKYAYTLHPSVL